MKHFRVTIGVFILGLFLVVEGVSQTPTPTPNTSPPPLIPTGTCDSLGRINGIFYTSCFPWLVDNDPNTAGNQSDGYVGTEGVTKYNDRPRLQRAITAAYGKLIFNEGDYYIDESLTLFPFRTLVGNGRYGYAFPEEPNTYLTSKIVQTVSGKAIFSIGGGIQSVAIRDLALTAGVGTSGTVGILAQNGTTAAASLLSTEFEFTNLTFTGLSKGIYVNARAYGDATPQCQPNGEGCEGFWRFDNVKLDHAKFENCQIGVHVNSKNSGWSMKNLNIDAPPGNALTGELLTANNLSGLTFGLFLQRITYSTIEEVIAGGPANSSLGPATAMIYVGEHANLNIQSTIDERFRNSVYIYGDSQLTPINLTNNFFQSPLNVSRSLVVSTANRFNYDPATFSGPFASVNNASKVFSFGDSFCNESTGTCTDTSYETLDVASTVMSGSNQYHNRMSGLRIGTSYASVVTTNFFYDISRNAGTGLLDFIGNQTGGYAGYRFKTSGGEVVVNYDGSVTFGTVTSLSSTAPNGTQVYCSTCQETNPCSSGGSGAMAKRINGSWKCS